MNEFDGKAAGWDMNPVHLERSKVIADLLIAATPNGQQMKALDFGAGSGILSLLLKEHLNQITLMDGSVGMINVIKEKLAAGGITNLTPVHINLEKESFTGEYDLIFSQMVFHHVEDIDGVLNKFYSLLNPGGFLAIADLYPEDGSFHGEGFTGHLGFDPEELSSKLSAHGFRDITFRECFVMKKVLDNGENRLYPIFLMFAGK
jgi:tRNA (cmo5U34)-methyltransferase